ncbi:MAG TPA: PaaI family thioesterase [Hyphomicrobiaceae bacterium]|jgi:uncharacterized protein (TIGR00369 family)|nr:PaaI family thioesterase [Hyphomicrobiaceae bacterium]
MSIPSSIAAAFDAARLQQLIAVRFPQMQAGGRSFIIEDVGSRSARVRMTADPRNTRPGGTIAGPAMFALADFTVYVAIVGTLGEPGFEAVTSSLNINFLARPEPNDMMAVAKLIRLGRRLSVGEVELFSEGVPEIVAHAVATYALPQVK